MIWFWVVFRLAYGSPQIEPDSDGSWITAHSPHELETILGNCETVVIDPRCNACRMVASATFAAAADSRGSAAIALTKNPNDEKSKAPRPGAVLVALRCEDFRFINASSTNRPIVPAQLEYPVRAIFSTKLRPLRFKGKIEFRDVVFRYPTDLRKPVLNGISFVVEPGQKVALVGPTGCGKSSCMALLQRLYHLHLPLRTMTVSVAAHTHTHTHTHTCSCARA